MKNLIFLLVTAALLSSCLQNDYPSYDYKYLTIDEAIAPASFTFGQKDTIKLKYTLPNSCHSFSDVYYEYKDNTRIVAIIALVDLENVCTQVTIPKEYNLIVTATQQEDYVFKFWKGTDSDGNNIYDEIVVPVN